MSLQQKLDERRNAGQAKYGDEIAELMNRGNRELRDSGIMKTALNVGQIAPKFSLKNQNGETVESTNLLGKGALVLTFYRGFW
jgi:cytochrome oxidase Cu insertion factor (SCO1/SenC/PrrC family)